MKCCRPRVISAKCLLIIFLTRGNVKRMLLAIFAGCAAQSTLMQTTHFVMLFFLQRIVFLSLNTTLVIIVIATLLACPFFQIFGGLSDKIGRKKVMLSGFSLSAVLIPFVFYFILQSGTGWFESYSYGR